LLFASAAAAQQAPSAYSTLEQNVISEHLHARNWQLDPEPEGKWIEDIRIDTTEVWDQRDPVPDWLNLFHTTTRQHVVRRELLFAEGDRYSGLSVAESARNLRTYPQLSIVLIVTARGSASDRVRVIVITKDVWSLRLNWELKSADAHLNYLLLNPSEENLFGEHVTVGAQFALDPATYAVGGSLAQSRIFGSHVAASLGANVVKNRDTDVTEGSYGQFYYGQPLYSLDARWAWGTAFLWDNEIARRYIGVGVGAFDARVTAVDDRIPETYRADRLYGGYQLERSFGHRFKFDVSVGAEGLRAIYRTQDLSAFDPAAVAEFGRRLLPVSDQRVSPFVQLHAHRTDYVSLIEVETLGLQEDFRVGHDFAVRVYPASTALGSSRDLIGVQSGASYTVPIGDGLIRPVVNSRVEYAAHARNVVTLETDLRVVSPRLGFGRLVLDGQFLDRPRNYLNAHSLLGGDGRLRGYAFSGFRGANLLAASAEFRTSSVDLFSAQVGAAAFYDVAGVADDLNALHMKQGAGLGLRVLFPEFDRIVFRADWGFPLSPGYATFPGALYISFKQAFGMPGVVAPEVLSTTLN